MRRTWRNKHGKSYCKSYLILKFMHICFFSDVSCLWQGETHWHIESFVHKSIVWILRYCCADMTVWHWTHLIWITFCFTSHDKPLVAKMMTIYIYYYLVMYHNFDCPVHFNLVYKFGTVCTNTIALCVLSSESISMRELNYKYQIRWQMYIDQKYNYKKSDIDECDMKLLVQ